MKKYFIGLTLLTVLSGSVIGATITSKTTTTNGGAWTTATNWMGNVVPGTNDDVIIAGPITISTNVSVKSVTINASKTLNISGSSTPTFTSLSISGFLVFNSTGSVTVTSLIINSGGFFTLGQGGTVNLTGDFTNNGSFSDSSNGTISFNGSSTQTINSPSAIDFYNINVGSNAIVTLSSTAQVNLNGVLTLNGSGTFDADGPGAEPGTGVFTVKSGSITDGARIAELPTPGNLTGQLTVQRYIDGRTGGDYRYLSVPVQNGTADSWKTSIGLTGNFSDHSTSADYVNITDSGNTNASAFYWDPVGGAYVAVDGSGGTALSTSLSSRKGYVVYNFNDLGIDVAINYIGTIEEGDVPIATSTTANAFTLVPNPYPAPIDWDLVYGDGTGPNGSAVNSAIYVRNGVGSYTAYVANVAPPNPGDFAGEIAIGESFWAQATAASPSGTLTLSESNKISDPTIGATLMRKKTSDNYVWFKLASGTKSDWTCVRFHPGATDDQDRLYDAVKLPNDNFNFSSFTSAGKVYAINSVAEISSCSKTFGLNVADVTAGDHTISFDDFSKFQLSYNVVLVDHFLNLEKAVTPNLSYPFSITSDAKSFGNTRFELRFENTVKPTIAAQGLILTSNMATGNQWYKDGQAITGATGSTYTVSSSGSYSVKTTASGGCVGTSDNLTMVIAGVNEVSDALVVYPNPVLSIVTIDLSQALDASLTGVKLYDAQGNVVASSDNDQSLLKPGEKSIDLSTFKSGVYILNIASGPQVKSIRLVKK